MALPKLPSLTLVTDRTLYRAGSGSKANPLPVIEAAIAGGVDIVQLRPRAMSGDDLALYAVALRLRELTLGKARFVVTGDIELAEKCEADGVLLFERSYKPSEARAFLRTHDASSVVGAFARTVTGASRAERGGADYVQTGPAFDQDAEPDKPNPGLTLVRKMKDAVQVPVIAFGGVNSVERVVDCLRYGADGVAVTDAILKAPDPQFAASTLRTALDAAWRALYGEEKAHEVLPIEEQVEGSD